MMEENNNIEENNKIEENKSEIEEGGPNVGKEQINKENPKKQTKKFLIFVVIVSVLLAGGYYLTHYNCSGSACSLTGNAVAVDSSPIVAEFIGGQITADKLDKDYDMFFFLRGIPKSYSSLLPKSSFLNQTLSEEVLYLEAVKNGYELGDEEVETGLEDSLTSIGLTVKEFKTTLNNESIEYDSVLDFYKKQLTITKFMNETLFKGLGISEQEAEDYYDENPDFFEIPEQIRASHILVNSSEQAEEIIEKLDNGGNFSELAEENSIDSNTEGGNLGFFGKGQMVLEFENAAFSLKKIGEYTETPVKTDYGYHIIMLTGREPAKKLTFEESKEDIKKKLLAEKENRLVSDYLDDLLEKADVKVYEENINKESE